MFLFTRDSADELTDLIEDMVAYFCEENKVCGEQAWKIISAYSEAKVMEFSMSEIV